MDSSNYLKNSIEHIDIKSFDSRPIIDSYRKMAFQARNLATAADILNRMINDSECKIFLTLAGSLFSAGLKNVVVDMIESNMVDVIVSTGAIIIDQDFFEALGFKHYIGTPQVNDDELRNLKIDRIYDTYINESELRICDDTIRKIADSLLPKSYSSREFTSETGKYLETNGIKSEKSVILSAYRSGIPIFVPAFSDCSAGFGLIAHQLKNKKEYVAIDSIKDFLELTQIKIESEETGLLIVGGGVPKNFAQDVVVAADILGYNKPMHKYAIQLTVADERDGGLSGSTLKEASSWGKVDTKYEQMVFGEATIIMPLLISNAYHTGYWKSRKKSNFLSLSKRN
jgi:deoxyhypusine synthase